LPESELTLTTDAVNPFVFKVSDVVIPEILKFPCAVRDPTENPLGRLTDSLPLELTTELDLMFMI